MKGILQILTYLIPFIGVFSSCITEKNNHKNFGMQTIQDSIIIEVGTMNRNESYVQITNLYKNSFILIDTATIQFNKSDIGNKCYLIISNQNNNIKSPVFKLKPKENILIKHKIDYNYDQLNLQLNLIVTVDSNVYIYDRDINAQVINTRTNKMFELYYFKKE